jgi:DNA-binding IclR family transcriptional regulator
MAPTSAVKGTAAIAKAVSILDAFLDGVPILSLASIAERTMLPRSTCHRVVSALVRDHYLERTADGEYRLGMRLFQLGALVAGPRALAQLADKEMTRLAEATQISAFLSIRDGDHSVCIHRVDRGQIILAPYRVGETLPLHVGAAPLVLLASMSDASVEAYLAGPLERMTVHTEIRPAYIRRCLNQIRRDGHFVARRDDIAIGLSAVGAPIIGPNGEAVAALSLSGLAAHMENTEALLAGVLRAARAIRQLLATPGSATAPPVAFPSLRTAREAPQVLPGR